MEIHALLGVLSGIVVGSCAVPYIISIVMGRTKPHPITWMLWALIGVLSLFFYWDLGARETIWIAVVTCVGPFIAATLSLKYWNWERGFSVFEYACLVLSMMSIVIWILSRDAVLALTFNITADALAALPTLVKAYRQPETENAWSWGIATLGALLSIAAIKEWSYGVALLPLYLLALYTLLATFSFRGRKSALQTVRENL